MDFRDALLNEQIYLIKDRPKLANSTDYPDDFHHTGSLHSSLFILYQPESEALPDSTVDMLDRLIGVLPDQNEAPCRIAVNGQDLKSLTAILQKYQPQWVFLHQIKGTTANYAEFSVGGSTCLAAPSLELLDKNPAERKKFWHAIQKMMGL